MHAVKTYDVIIIGAGPAGIFTALELADKGFKILMVEKGQDIRERIATSLNKKALPKDRMRNVVCGWGGAGANVFGTLLEAAKRMRAGDLDVKVDDKLMLGAYKDFAAELNGLNEVVQIAAQKQMKSERMRTELITNVSHDIKTPLTSIINYVDLLQKPHTEEEGKSYLEVLSRQSGRMKKLIDDLIELSKASTGNIPVELTKMDAVEAVNQALGEFTDKLTAAELTPVFRQPEEPLFVHADGRLAWRAMSNLLSNAVKYAQPGTRFYIDMVALDGKVCISFKNISRAALNVSAEELMERFVRGEASRNQEGSGTGKISGAHPSCQS